MAPARSIVQHTQPPGTPTHYTGMLPLARVLGIDTEASLFQAVRKQPDLGLTFQSCCLVMSTDLLHPPVTCISLSLMCTAIKERGSNTNRQVRQDTTTSSLDDRITPSHLLLSDQAIIFFFPWPGGSWSSKFKIQVFQSTSWPSPDKERWLDHMDVG